jgi:hypothetical protein
MENWFKSWVHFYSENKTESRIVETVLFGVVSCQVKRLISSSVTFIKLVAGAKTNHGIEVKLTGVHNP